MRDLAMSPLIAFGETPPVTVAQRVREIGAIGPARRIVRIQTVEALRVEG